MPLSPGTSLGRYEIHSQLGAGGMGEVYLAHDTRLNRKVALKVLPADLVSNRERLHRFEQEAQAASALNHPNIITIHEVGAEGDTHFIATEFVDGETLRRKWQTTRLEAIETLNIATQIAAALDAAHRSNIVHRDVKPENVMVREDGIVKVLDFGLAKLTEKKDDATADSRAPTRALIKTSPGIVMGTVAYMSPEQARGLSVDARTDIFSLGVVLYEVLTGRLPYKGETTSDVIAAILKTEPAPLNNFNQEIPGELERIVNKALVKDREERYQTAKDLLVDLRRLKKQLEVQTETERTASAHKTEQESATQIITARPTSSAAYATGEISKHKLGFAITLSALLLAGVGLGYWFFAVRSSNSTQIESIAVLPFVNESGNPDVEYLSDGMTESLINSLSQLPKILVKARSSVFSYKGRDVKPQTIASELSVQAILNGRFVLRGNDLTLYLSLVDARKGNQLWGEQYNRKLTELISLQKEIARDVSNKLRVKLSGADEQRLAKNYTTNAEAYQLYLKGRYFWNKRTPEDFQKSRDYFQRAIDLDPTYALAYSGLADFYGISVGIGLLSPNETWPKHEAIVRKALELDPNLAEIHNSLAGLKRHYYRDWAGAEQEFKRAIVDPNYAEAHVHYGGHLTVMGRFDEALIERKRGIELDPLAPSVNLRLGDTLYFMRRYTEAIEQYRKTLELDSTSPLIHERLGNAYEQKGMFEQAIGEWSAAFALAKNNELATMLERTFKESGFNAAVRASHEKGLSSSTRKRGAASTFRRCISRGSMCGSASEIRRLCG